MVWAGLLTSHELHHNWPGMWIWCVGLFILRKQVWMTCGRWDETSRSFTTLRGVGGTGGIMSDMNHQVCVGNLTGMWIWLLKQIAVYIHRSNLANWHLYWWSGHYSLGWHYSCSANESITRTTRWWAYPSNFTSHTLNLSWIWKVRQDCVFDYCPNTFDEHFRLPRTEHKRINNGGLAIIMDG
jgi:hypothetical protein